MSKKGIIILLSVVAAVVVIAAVAAVVFILNRPDTTAYGNGEGINGEVGHELPVITGPNGVGSFSIAPTSLGDISITPLSATNLGVAIDSGFLISSDVRTLTAEHLQAYLSVRSGEAFTLEAQPNNAFLLTFDENLENNQVYNLVYQPSGHQAASHAFQTADIFRVSASSPANNTHGVPDNAGIEVIFSQPLANADDFENAFSIEPAVEGRFIQRDHSRDNTYIFVPTSLDFGTRYTVTISSGLISSTGEVMTESHEFSFSTQWGTSTAPLFSIAGSAYETFLPWNEVFIALNISRDFPGREFYIDLYSFQNADDFINFTDTGSGRLVDSFELEVQEFEGEWQSFFYLFLGQSLPEGYYVAEVRSTNPQFGNIVLHKFIQVSALSVYSLSVDGDAVFWVHDAETGQPASGARISVDGNMTTVNSDGIAIVQTGQSRAATIIIEHGNHLPFAYTKPTFAERHLIPSDRFLSYMYTDRPSYRPSDTIDVFGVIMPRYGHSHLPSDVFTLRIGNILELPITLDAHHSFAMRIPVTNMFGWPDIIVEVNGERLMSAWISFFDYTNLGFVLDGQLNQIAHFSGDYAQAEISVTTFAGMPVDGIVLQRGHGDDAITLTTDSRGIVAGGLPVGSGWGDWQPQWGHIWFSIISDAQTSQSIGLPMIVVPADIMLEHDYNGGDAVTITTNRVLIDRINQHYADAQMWTVIDADVFRGSAVDVDFAIEITRHVTTRTLRNQTYDHINRRNVRIYNFDTVDSHYDTILGRTEDGVAEITGLPVSDDPMIRYSMEIIYQDSVGRRVTLRLVDNSWRHFRQETAIRHFGFVLEERRLGVGETTNVSVVENPDAAFGWWGLDVDSEEIPLTEGRMLAVVVRDGVMSTVAGNPRGVPITFTEDLISDAYIFGAYFDGQYIFPVAGPISINYDFSERELDIELSFDAERYQPGDEVTVIIQTSAQAQVLISVVDESSILSSWHEANFLARLYQSSWARWPNMHQFASHTQHNFGGAGSGAEGGGGGDEGFDTNFRDRFIDNPIFELVQTDANGIGTLTFTLPDQVTSWRVTAIALTQDGYAGDTRCNIISALDFYVDLLLTTEYIVGDDIAAVARAFGNAGEAVNFTFNVLRDGVIVYTDTQVASRTATANAEKLGAGDYVMQVIATSGVLSDAVELPFTVANTGMILPMRAAGQISDTSGIESLAMRSLPVQLTLTNADIGSVVGILNGIWNDRSQRTDYMAATAYINYFFTGEADFSHVLPRIHTSSGGIAELTYEDANLFFTARFAASFPEFVNSQHIVRYIQNEMTDGASARERAAGLLALAAVGQPVLLDIQREISAVDPNDHLTVLYLAAALVAIGDDAGAVALSGSFPRSTGHLPSATDRETANALVLFINTTINPQAAWNQLNYVEANRYVSDVLERINFVKRTRIMGTTISEVQYTLNGTTHTIRLEDFDRHSLHLTKEQFDALNLVPISGATDFHINFFGYGAGNWDAAGNRIDIRRTIVRDGDLFRIDLTVTLPSNARGFYTIYDRLPSNMRFVPMRQEFDWSNYFFVRHVQRQLVEISFFNDRYQSDTRTVSYFAMELFEANMADGTTYISNRCVHNHIWGATR